MTHAPQWATWLILSALPVIVGTVLYLFAEPGPPEDNGAEHYQEDAARDEDPDVLAAAA